MGIKLKSLMLSIILTICLFFTGCVTDPACYNFDYEDLIEKVVKIELINYDYADVKSVKKRENILPFDFDKMEIIETLDNEKFDDLLFDLSKVFCHICDDLTEYLNSVSGKCLKFTYSNGDFLIFCFEYKVDFITEYTNEGNVGELLLYYVYDNDFPNYFAIIDLVNKYFETQIK